MNFEALGLAAHRTDITAFASYTRSIDKKPWPPPDFRGETNANRLAQNVSVLSIRSNRIQSQQQKRVECIDVKRSTELITAPIPIDRHAIDRIQ